MRKALIGAGLHAGPAAEAFAPVERLKIVFHAQHAWRVDRGACEEVLVQLAALGHAEQLRQGAIRRIGFETADGVR